MGAPVIDQMRIWLLRPGVEGFGELPSWFDESAFRSAAEQLGQRWRPIVGHNFRLEGSGLWDRNECHELLGAIHLWNQLVMLFENGLAAIVESDRSFEVARLQFEVSWLPVVEPSDNSGEKEASTNKRSNQNHSYQPEIYFNHDWNHSGNRFATEHEAEVFVAHLRATWIPQGFIKRDRVQIAKSPPNASLNWKTKQAEPLQIAPEPNMADAAVRAV